MSTETASTEPANTDITSTETSRMSTETTISPDASPRRRGYGSLWAAVPRELGFLLLTMPIAVTGLVIASTVFFTGVGMIALVVGIFITVAAFYVARGFGTLELIRLGWAGRRPVTRPNWARDGREAGFWRAAFMPFVDGHYWLYVLHTLVVNPIVSIFSWTVTIVWVSVALGGTTGWIWQGYIPDDGREFWLVEWLADRVFPGNDFTFDVVAGERILELVIGVIFLLTLPFVLRGLTLAHDGVARGMLGAWRSEALEVEVAALAASRGAAVQAEDASLRRLERDIHDGPQQRLVRLQMDLATIERRLERDPDSAKELLGEAREQARETLDELRALSRGFAPPLLQDRGLASALESLASRSPVAVDFENLLPESVQLPAAIERNAYFIVAELLTNAVKHADASSIRLRVAERDAGPAGHWLDLWVTDNGSGGATVAPGHGLAGLQERVQGLRGQFLVDSPVGGPTIVGAHIPFRPEASAGAVD